MSLALIGATGALVYWILRSSGHVELAPSAVRAIESARAFHAGQPWTAIAVFCCAHMIASTFSVPGSCTVLNTMSGAVFGFWQGCAVVYAVTMLSAVTGYAIGAKLRSTTWLKRFQPYVDSLNQKSREHDYLYFVTLRLSPLIPFGILNLLAGTLGIPFGLYLMTTWVGVFFDVVLLNNLGAAAIEGSWGFAISFAVLFAVMFVIRKATPKWIRAEL